MASIAQHLLNIKAVELNTVNKFTWASGIQSPIYCDNRLTIAYPEVRRQLAKELSELVKTFGEVEIVAGTSTAGIPHAAFVSEVLDLPMAYVRGSKKSHGKGNQIEGANVEGKKVIVIEDLISTGGSSLEAVNGVKAQGGEVVGVVAIFTYVLEKAKAQFEAADVEYKTVTNLDELLEEAVAIDYIDSNQAEEIKAWRDKL